MLVPAILAALTAGAGAAGTLSSVPAGGVAPALIGGTLVLPVTGFA